MAGGNFGGGNGSAGSPFIVDDVQDLLTIDLKSRETGNLHYKQRGEIDMSGNPDFPGIGGVNGPQFNGTYDGDGYSIINFEASGPSVVGLFYSTNKATFKNVIIKNADLENTGESNLAVLCNISSGATFKNCYVSAKVKGTMTTALVTVVCRDYDERATFLDCNATGTVIGGENTGGFLSILDNADVTNCAFKGDVYLGDDGDGAAAGFATRIDNCIFKNTDSTALIVGMSNMGGFASVVNDSFFYDCNSCVDLSTVEGRLDSYGNLPARAAGFASISTRSHYEDCHSTGDVTANTYSGGFCGSTDDDYFWKCSAFVDVKAVDVWAGGFIPNGGNSMYVDCAAFGSVTGEDLVSGFCRYEDETKLTNCHALNSEVAALNSEWGRAGTFGYNFFSQFRGFNCTYNANGIYSAVNPAFEYSGSPTTDLSTGGFDQPTCKFFVITTKSETKCFRHRIR